MRVDLQLEKLNLQDALSIPKSVSISKRNRVVKNGSQQLNVFVLMDRFSLLSLFSKQKTCLDNGFQLLFMMTGSFPAMQKVGQVIYTVLNGFSDVLNQRHERKRMDDIVFSFVTDMTVTSPENGLLIACITTLC